VTTDAGDSISAPVVINAGGPWAGRLCRRLGLEVPLTVIRPEQAYLVPPVDYGPERHIFGDLLTGLYWKPEPAGWTRVGKLSYAGDREVPDPDDYDEGVGREFIDYCRERLSRRMPGYRNAVSWGGCGALYTCTPDAHALIGPMPGLDGFLLVSGFSGHGFKMGPAVGRGVASLVTGSDPGPFDAAFFDVNRFRDGRPVTTSYEYGILG
jgi:glycine/D-amino acid oxidase-like deaminating enzyme